MSPSRRPRRVRFFDDRSRGLDRFGPLLALTVATIATGSLVDLRASDDGATPQVVELVVTAVLGATVLLALHASGLAKPWRRVLDAVVILGVLSALLLVIAGLAGARSSSVAGEGPSPVWLVMVVVAPVCVVGRLLRHKTVTARTLQGAVAGYLLVAIAFYFVFLTVDHWQQEPFFLGSDESGEPTSSYMYFSLVTISTLGYGDLAPATPAAQLASTTEAVLGQVYLVTFVAMIVGLVIQNRGRHPEEGRPTEVPDDREG